MVWDVEDAVWGVRVRWVLPASHSSEVSMTMAVTRSRVESSLGNSPATPGRRLIWRLRLSHMLEAKFHNDSDDRDIADIHYAALLAKRILEELLNAEVLRGKPDKVREWERWRNISVLEEKEGMLDSSLASS